MMLEACFVLGLLAGTLSGFFGIGGGVIVVPALCWLFVHFHVVPSPWAVKVAIATSLAIMIMTLLSAVWAHWRQQSVRWDIFRPMLPWVILGTFLGTVLAYFLPAEALKIFLALFMLVMGGRLLLRHAKGSAIHRDKGLPVSRRALVAVALAASTLAGVLGVSGGVLLGPVFLRSGLTVAESAGTSVVCGLAIGLCATAVFVLAGATTMSLPGGTGYIYWPAFFGVSVASVLSAPLGARLTQVLPREVSRRLLGMLLVGMSLSMFFSAR